jgi:hypothetical protein
MGALKQTIILRWISNKKWEKAKFLQYACFFSKGCYDLSNQ